MADVPAYCKHCRIMFRSGIRMSGDSQGRLVGNTTQCPQCMRPVAIGDGNYATRLENDALLQVSDASREAAHLTNIYNQIVSRDLERLKKSNPKAFAEVESVVQQVASNIISEKEAGERIAAHLPRESAEAVKKLAKSGGLKTFLKAAAVAGGLAIGLAELVEAGVKVYDRAFPAPAPQAQPSAPLAPNVTIENHIVINPPGSAEKPTGSLSREQIRRLKQQERARMRMSPLPPRRPKDL